MRKLFTSESVTEGHPDKLCDQVSDAVLDALLAQDPMSRVACETCATTGMVMVMGEITTTAKVDIPAIVRDVVLDIGYNDSSLCFDGNTCAVLTSIHAQSPDIAMGVDDALETRTQDANEIGAGDQGIMYGYACWETVELLPAPVVLANRITSLLTTCREEKLISGMGPDGKAQVSVQYAFGVPERVDTIVISCQHDADKDPDELREELRRLVIARACHDVRIDENTKIFINPSGRFVLGGFEADTGLTGRKLMVDTYGGLAPHGGGALSGKDGTKVDRSGAYMARYVAKNIVAAGLADVCTVSLAYAIGQAEPVAVEIDTQESGYYDDAFLTEAVRRVFDFTPTGMIRALDLDKPFFAEVCNNCHFMHPQAAWEQTDKTEKLRMTCAELEDERT
jgi:S-adenosylmethionine synthetase